MTYTLVILFMFSGLWDQANTAKATVAIPGFTSGAACEKQAEAVKQKSGVRDAFCVAVQ